MELYKEIITNMLEEGIINIEFPKEFIELECCSALQKIKLIIEDDSYEVDEFEIGTSYVKLEDIIDIVESIGSQHDFG